MQTVYILLFSTLLFTSCSENLDRIPTRQEKISGRLSNVPLYQAAVPASWEPIKPTNNISDTKEPLAGWKKDNLLLLFHNFSPELKIAPAQQVERWKKQLGEGTEIEVSLTAHGGFGGLRLIGFNEQKSVIAYAFQMNETLRKKLESREAGADWTVKVTGDKASLNANLVEIEEFVNSIELIEPIR